MKDGIEDRRRCTQVCEDENDVDKGGEEDEEDGGFVHGGGWMGGGRGRCRKDMGGTKRAHKYGFDGGV